MGIPGAHGVCDDCGRPLIRLRGEAKPVCLCRALPDPINTYRGEKPPDHGQRVSHGMRLTIIRKQLEIIRVSD
jgi:hypothetical protein